MSKHIPRTLRPIVNAARERGWTTDLTSKGHIRLLHPRYGIVVTSGSPSDWRARKNLEARLRRAERGDPT